MTQWFCWVRGVSQEILLLGTVIQLCRTVQSWCAVLWADLLRSGLLLTRQRCTSSVRGCSRGPGWAAHGSAGVAAAACPASRASAVAAPGASALVCWRTGGSADPWHPGQESSVSLNAVTDPVQAGTEN